MTDKSQQRERFDAPVVIDRTEPNRAYVTLGFRNEAACDEFVKATRNGYDQAQPAVAGAVDERLEREVEWLMRADRDMRTPVDSPAVWTEHMCDIASRYIATIRTASPSQPAAEHPVVKLLLELAAATYYAVDDSADHMESFESGERYIRVTLDHQEKIEAVLDKLDELPDDQPGYIMGPVAKAAWALRASPADDGEMIRLINFACEREYQASLKGCNATAEQILVAFRLQDKQS